MMDELKQENTREYAVETPDGEVHDIEMQVNAEKPGAITPSKSISAGSSVQMKEVGDKINQLARDLPQYFSEFFSEYKRPLTYAGLILGAIVALKLTFALLDAVDDIPLLAPAFELVGFGYSIWFVYRYLLKASSRQELSEDFNALKDQVLGNRM
ncbi:MAG: CAAD domain-containing protein [Thainema sp.]